MKITLDIADDLYLRVNTRATEDGLSLDSVTTMLLQSWLDESTAPVALTAAEQWVKDWVALGAETMRDVPAGPTATTILSADRDRLEHALYEAGCPG